MQDIYHYFGSDIAANINGDLQTASDVTRTQQRILRRLLTAPGSYIWHVEYGAGLPFYVGEVLSTANYQKITGIIKTQIQLEQSVARSPAPVVTLQAISEGLYCSIKYTEAATQTPQFLTFTVTK